MTDIAAIAARLTKAQREALAAVGTLPRGAAAIRMAHVLKRAGLVCDPLVHVCTPLGLAVRQHLQERS